MNQGYVCALILNMLLYTCAYVQASDWAGVPPPPRSLCFESLINFHSGKRKTLDVQALCIFFTSCLLQTHHSCKSSSVRYWV